MAATARIEFRVRPETRERIEQAAALVNLPVSEFVRATAEARADEILRAERVTMVPADFFDRLIAALDEPPVPNARLRRAAARADSVFSD